MKITNKMLLDSQMRAIKNLVCQRHKINNSKVFRKDVAEIKQKLFEDRISDIFENLKEECKKYE
jgi:hypothetical protein|nr:MAG TPA: hypothetical protein [Caudoviricetes sp.]